MEIRHGSKFDAVKVQRETDYAIHHAQDNVRNALEFIADNRKADRKNKLECKRCFYMRQGRIGGTAITQQSCGICEKVIMYSSTNTDAMCKECAEKYQLCVYCGADQELRPRRIVKF